MIELEKAMMWRLVQSAFLYGYHVAKVGTNDGIAEWAAAHTEELDSAWEWFRDHQADLAADILIDIACGR